ncbi:RNA-directed DNA polymerase, eukaryota, partial [Tanacetum coccineum]
MFTNLNIQDLRWEEEDKELLRFEDSNKKDILMKVEIMMGGCFLADINCGYNLQNINKLHLEGNFIEIAGTLRSWATATTEGVLVNSIDKNFIFDPTDLDIDITSEAVTAALGEDHPNRALNLGLRRNEAVVIDRCIVVVPPLYNMPVINNQRMMVQKARSRLENPYINRLEPHVSGCNKLLLDMGESLQNSLMECSSCGEDNDVNEVAETLFDESSGQKKNHSEDPFGFYSLLNKNKDDTYVNGTKDEQSIKYPPGFTPEAENREFNLSEENVRSTNEIESQGAAPEIGGSILCLLEELVKGVWLKTNVNLLIVVVYAPQDSSDKRMLWDYLTHVSSQWDGEVVMM